MSDPAALSRLPAVDAVLRLPDADALAGEHGRQRLATAVRDELAQARARVRAGGEVPTAAEVLDDARTRLDSAAARRVRRVVNATGVVVHTNLGRAPLSDAARRAVTEALGYATVEYDLDTGERGSRTGHLGDLAAELCGTEAATTVNNGAAGLLLVLAALAGGREVVVSRGELIEIGGSFRLPDVMTMAGVRLVEVGTTNRTRPDDYRDAIGPDTALLLKVHRSNFRQVGFTREVTTAELAAIGRAASIPVVHDTGSGLIHDVADGPLAAFADEPPARRALADGADVVVFSGDKLLGGPQAGIVAGRRALVDRCARHPLARALRIDKLQRAALEATLLAHLRNAVPTDVPSVAMLTADPDALRARAEALAARVRGQLGDRLAVDDLAGASSSDVPHGRPRLRVEPTDGVVGGGALPGTTLPSWGLVIDGVDPDRLAARLRHGEVPVVCRIERDRVIADVRTVASDDEQELVAMLVAALG